MGDDPSNDVNCSDLVLWLPGLPRFWYRHDVSRNLVCFLCFIGFSWTARAVVVVSGGPNNTTPSGQPFFNNVGTLNGASVIYLSDGWVLTANHVSSVLPASVTFGGTDYATEAGTLHRLTNAGLPPSVSTLTDIVLFRLGTPPPLPGVTIASATPTIGSNVMMIGNGRTQLSTPTYWNRTVLPGLSDDTWVETTPALSNISGFKTTPTKEVRWGENQVDANFFIANVGSIATPVHVAMFSTRFDVELGGNEAQAVVGDSGGAVFSFNGGAWELSGMMDAVFLFENQPNGTETAVDNQRTAIADLAFYRSQIVAIIPEPSITLFGVLNCFILIRRRR